jgi:uncharacterized cupin superfamily protein
MIMKIVLDDAAREGAIRVDLAWELFFASKAAMPQGHGERLVPFANWLWDELGRKAGNLNRNSPKELTLAIPSLGQDGLDFLLRLVSFWADEVYVKKAGTSSGNLWKKPVANVFDDKALDGSERSIVRAADESYMRFLMPLLGPGRGFFRVEVIQKGASPARYHSHSEVDEYYLILDGSGTLRFNGKDIVVNRGDLIAKPTGPDATSQLIADQGVPLRVLDMELWHDRFRRSKDLIFNPDFNEIFMRGPGWASLVPAEALISPEDFGKYYDEGYRRMKDGSWVPSKNRGHKKIREKT